MARVCPELCHWPGAAGVPSRVGLFATLRTVARQEPVSVGFSRQECWSGLAFSSPGSGWRKGGKHTLRLNVVQQATNIRIFKLWTFKDTDAFMCPIVCVSSHVWCRLPPLWVVVLLCTSPDSTIWRTVVQYLHRIGSGSLMDSILSHQRQVWVKSQLSLYLLLLMTLQLYRLLPPLVSNSSYLFMWCQPLYASSCTILLYFSRHCTIRLFIFVHLLLCICVKNIINLYTVSYSQLC